jgi:predicted NUDIX family phosphoesterase
LKGLSLSDVQTERVLVVPTALFHRLGHFQGFSSEIGRYFGELFGSEHVSYRPRKEVEVDPSFKQLIPYLIFRHRDVQGNVMVFQYTRGAGQGEGRLHHKRSVGIGGHISTVDCQAGSDGDAYQAGMQRELDEEVAVESAYSSRCVGLINDDLTEVGKVHLGVVHLVDVERPEVHSREKDIIEASFRPVGELLADLSGFETWSQICLKALFAEK